MILTNLHYIYTIHITIYLQTEHINKNEEQIELVFRSKRTNVFATGYDDTKEVSMKVITKTKRQAHIIRM